MKLTAHIRSGALHTPGPIVRSGRGVGLLVESGGLTFDMIGCIIHIKTQGDNERRGTVMIDRLMALGFNAGAAKFLADEIAAGRKVFDKIKFTAQIDLRFVPKMNAEHDGAAK